MEINNFISFFDRVSNPEAVSPVFGRFGEWLLDDQSRKVCEIRQDDLKSLEGIEVIQKARSPESSCKHWMRIALKITVVPIIIALVDKLIFRVFYTTKLHINRLPDGWRVKQDGVLLGKEKPAQEWIGNQFNQLILTPDLSAYKVDSILLYVAQEHSWKNPEVYALRIDKNHERKYINQLHFEEINHCARLLKDNTQIDFPNPQSTLDHFIRAEKDNNLIIASLESMEPTDEAAQKIKESRYYRGSYSSCHEFNIVHPTMMRSVFFDRRSNCYFLQNENRFIVRLSYNEQELTVCHFRQTLTSDTIDDLFEKMSQIDKPKI